MRHISRHKQELFLKEFVTISDEIKQRNLLIIVGGKNDKKALRNLGFINIITLSTPIYKIIEIVRDEVVILTDLDQKGRQLYAKIKSECSQRGIRINDTLRHFLYKETPLAHIEGLDTFIERRIFSTPYNYHNIGS